MPRLSIDITPAQHQTLKAIAALSGKSIKDYVLEKAIPEAFELEEQEALAELEALLRARMLAAQRGEMSSKTVGEILAQAKQEHADASL